MKSGIGAAMAGGKRGAGGERPRQQGDWYPTPPDCTQVLLDRIDFGDHVWEPCCGDGSLARVMEARGIKVVGTDLHDRGYGDGHGAEHDILKADRLLAECIVTNPPFNIAAPIIEHLLSLKPKKMALLLKSSFWHAKSRAALFANNPPSRIIALTWRPDFLSIGRPTMEVSWCVWEHGHNDRTYYELADRPARPRHAGNVERPTRHAAVTPSAGPTCRRRRARYAPAVWCRFQAAAGPIISRRLAPPRLPAAIGDRGGGPAAANHGQLIGTQEPK